MLTALNPLLDLVFPPRCPLCTGAVATHGGLCGACWKKLVPPASPACRLCQLPLDASDSPFDAPLEDAEVCGPCHATPPLHDGVHAATLYNAASRRLVLAFKYGGRIALAPLLARMMAARLPEREGAWLVVPVPLHRWRLWGRGFNQSALLARHVAGHIGGRLVVDGLWRQRRTPMLGGLGKAERARVMERAIALNTRRAGAWAGAKVLLVDDVLTSGATTDACIRVLRAAGAARVEVVCFARVNSRSGWDDDSD